MSMPSIDRRSLVRVLHHGAVLLLLAGAASVAAWVAFERASATGESVPPAWSALLGGVGALAGVLVVGERVRSWLRGEWSSTSGLSLRLALCLVVGSWLLIVFLRQPPRPGDVEAVWGVVGTLFPILVVAAERSPGGPRWAPLRGVDTLLFNVCAVLLFVQLGLELTARFSPSPLFIRSNSSAREVIAQHRLAPGKIYAGSPMNSGGYHDREFERQQGSVVVAAIGDSFSIGVVPHFFHYTTVAERELPGVQIFNIGVSGIGPAEYLHLLQTEVLALRPDFVLLSLFVGNDIAEGVRYHHGVRSVREWYDAENVLLHLVTKRLMRSWAADLAVANESFGERPDLDPGVLGYSEDTERLERAFPQLRDPLLEKSWLGEEAYVVVEKERIPHAFQVDQLGAYDLLFPVLERIRALCGDTPLLVLLIPTELQVDDEWWDELRTLLPPGLHLDRDLPQRIVSRWLDRRGIPYLDPLSSFRAVPVLEDGRRHLFHWQDTHINRRGNEVLGRELAVFLDTQIRRASGSRVLNGTAGK